jgi:hypothetical protein
VQRVRGVRADEGALGRWIADGLLEEVDQQSDEAERE